MGPDLLDLRHQGAERVIGAYLLDTVEGPALFDCGPTTCLERLKEALGELALELGDLRHLLLSHIHLDHAGAAGVLSRDSYRADTMIGQARQQIQVYERECVA